MPGWTSPVGGNVVGLDESQAPTLADMADLDDPALARVRDTGGRVTLAIHDCRKPVIAAINGPAVGIGATMTLAMDARLVSTQARFGLVLGRIGIVPEANSTWYLPRLVGLPRALDLVLSADILDADTVVEAGLAGSAHQPDELLPAARAFADRWTSGAHRSRSRWHDNWCGATPLTSTPSRHIGSTRWRCSTPASATVRRE